MTSTYAENCVHTIEVIKKDNKSFLWIKIHNIQDKLGVKNMSDLTTKAIRDIHNAETPTKEQSKNIKDMQRSL